MSKRRLPVTAILGLSILALAAVVVGTGGAYAYFTSSATATATLSESGSIGLGWNDSTSGSDLGLAIGPLQPGDSVQRVADLTNTGSTAIARIQLGVVGTDTGTTSDGIQMAIDRCSVAWAQSGSGYVCAATTTSVTPDRPVQAVIDLLNSPAFGLRGVDHLRVTLRLPDTAPSSAQGTTGTVTITATGTSSQ
jgi:predicted ribosomally synthesized peptide with SipW-like signal peptide